MPPMFVIRIGIALGLAGLAWLLHRAGDLGSPLATYILLRVLALAALITLLRSRLPADSPPWWQVARLRIVVLATLLVTAIGALALEKPAPRGSEAEFERLFAQKLASAPEYRPVEDDWALYDYLHTQVRGKYWHDGWTVAEAEFDEIILGRIAVYGDDAHMLAFWRAYLALERRLRDNPGGCLAYIRKPVAFFAYPEAAAEIAQYRAAYVALARSGAERLAARPRPLWFDPTRAEWVAAWAVGESGPYTLTAAEEDALSGTDKPALVCSGDTKWFANALSKRPDIAAHILRTMMLVARPEQKDIAYWAAWASEPYRVPPGFACPAPGTRFVIDAATDDGRPIVQTILEQRGIECRVYSTGHGLYGVAAGLIFDRSDAKVAQALAKLWPLEIGKTSELAEPPHDDDGGIRMISSVTGYGWYRVGDRDVTGYQIDIAVTEVADDTVYIQRVVWSPELRWRLGQQTEFVRGYDDDGALGTWSLVQVLPPDSGPTTPTRTAWGPGSPPR